MDRKQVPITAIVVLYPLISILQPRLQTGVWTNSKNTPHLGGANGRSPLRIVENGI